MLYATEEQFSHLDTSMTSCIIYYTYSRHTILLPRQQPTNLARVPGTGRYQPLLLFSFFLFSFPYNSPSRYRLVELELEFFSPKFVVIVVVVVPTKSYLPRYISLPGIVDVLRK